MVVYHADCLYVRVADGGAEEGESAVLEVMRPALRFGGRFRVIAERADAVRDLTPIRETPHICGERAEFFSDFEELRGVVYGGRYFRPVADDARVFEEPRDVSPSELGDVFWIKPGGCFAVVLSLAQDRFSI